MTMIVVLLIKMNSVWMTFIQVSNESACLTNVSQIPQDSGNGTVSNNVFYNSLKDQDQLLIFVPNEEISNPCFVPIDISI